MPKQNKNPKYQQRSSRRGAAKIGVRQVPDGDAWELVCPRCARDRAEDINEVEAMLEAGEDEIAKDELRWLLSGCPDFIDAHRLLGEIALGEGDIPLARGHFGHAFRAGAQAVKKARNPQPLPYAREANRAFHQCGKGLLHCLKQLGKKKLAKQVAAQLLACDPSDPLGIAELLHS
ncbi:MAG: hypothetical protein VB876_04340 [Pirellulales bacterium]